MTIKFTFRGKEHYIESDANQYILHDGYIFSKSGEISGKKNVSYFSDFKALIQELLERGIRQSDARSLNDLALTIKEIKEEINQLFSAIKE